MENNLTDTQQELGFKSNLIKMAALGRHFQLGTLYDYTTDSIIPGELILKITNINFKIKLTSISNWKRHLFCILYHDDDVLLFVTTQWH